MAASTAPSGGQGSTDATAALGSIQPPGHRASRVTTIAGSGQGGQARGRDARFGNCLKEPISIEYAADIDAMFVSTFANGGWVLVRIDLSSNTVAELGVSPWYWDGFTMRRAPGGEYLIAFSFDRGLVAYPLRSGSGPTTLAGSSEGFVDGTGDRAMFSYLVYDLAINRSGTAVYLADCGNNAVRRASLCGLEPATVETLAGCGGTGTVDGAGRRAVFDSPASLALSLDETLLFVGQAGAIRAIQLSTAIVRTFVGNGECAFADGSGPLARLSSVCGLVVAPSGVLLFSDSDNARVRAVNIDGEVTTVAGTGVEDTSDGLATEATFNQPWALACGPGARLFVLDFGGHCIRVIDDVCPAAVSRYRIVHHMESSERVRAIALTLFILARGTSARLLGINVPGLRGLLNAGLERVIQWAQDALFPDTPDFERMHMTRTAVFGPVVQH